MVFQLHIPAFPLDQYIESFIYYKDFNPVHSIERFLPDGNINVVIDLTEDPKHIYNNETLQEEQTCRRIWFSGIRNKYITIPSARNCEMLVINFHKGRAYPFIRMPLHELTDLVVDGEQVLTGEIMNLRHQVQSLPVIAHKFRATEQYLLKHFGSRLEPNPFIDYAVNAIVQSPGQLTMESLAGKIGYSQKHLIHLFKEKVGLTPKAFLTIARFQKAILAIEKNEAVNWAGIAYDSGYYDQAHFINDFKRFSGFTPQQYVAMKYDDLNYVPVA